MTPVTPARSERLLLADLLDEMGPSAPTLCAGWLTRDLAAHIVLRDARPDTLPGMFLSPLAKDTKGQQDKLAQSDWSGLVERVRSGPPSWSPARWAPLEAAVNTLEFFVHHEDVRRANAAVPEREVPQDLADALWAAGPRLARLALVRCPVGVILHSDGRGEKLVRRAEPRVILRGTPGDLALYLSGRRAAAKVDVEGTPEAVAAFAAVSLDR
ncbi:MAG: TIGR03085 family metal-binding protein [Angustibacter sp.]